MRLVQPLRQAIQAPWLRDPLWTVARAVPAFDIDASRGELPIDRISGQNLTTFTRAASATFLDSTGTLQTAGANVLRRQWDATNRRWGWLVEEARTNLLLNSATLSTQTVTVAATAYTLSFYGTGSITRSGTSTGTTNGTGANVRTSVTFTPTAGSLTLTVSGSVTNANLEAGSFATSWIPTTGTSALRDADLWTVTGSNFSRWYNQASGTIYCQAAVSNTSANRFIVDISDGTLNEEIALYWAAAFNSLVNDGGATQANSLGGTVTAETSATHAFAYAANDFQGFSNSLALSADTSGTLPTVDRMTLGARINGTFRQNGLIYRLAYWPTRLSNSTLQILTR